MHSPTIGAIILTKNEEINLPTCLSNLEWVNELILVDSGSTDRTLEIAKEFGANIFIHRMDPFIIADQRNWSIDNCVKISEWVLFIDADEIVTHKLKEDIIYKINNPEGKVAFRLCFKFMFMGKWIKHVTQYPSWHDRLLKKGEVYFTGGVWEYFNYPPERIGFIREPYIHYGFNNGIANWIERHNRYSTAIAKRMFEYKNQKVDIKKLLSKNKNPRIKKRELEKIVAKLPFLLPLANFFYLFVVKKGFLDGYPGFVYACMLATHNFFVWLKFIELSYRKKGIPF